MLHEAQGQLDNICPACCLHSISCCSGLWENHINVRSLQALPARHFLVLTVVVGPR